MFEKYANKGLCGLSNVGNTCFINACMQIISHTYELNDFLSTKYNPKDEPKYAVLNEWNQLRQKLWTQKGATNSYKFVKAIHAAAAEANGRELFTSFTQNDLPEFLLFVIDLFHTALSREVVMTIQGTITNERDKMAVVCFNKIRDMYCKDYSEIWKLFCGVHVSQIATVANQDILSNTPETSYTLSVPIPLDNKSPTLIECIDLYTSPEILDGDNCVFNEKTNKKEAVTKTIRFWSLPQILIIDIKRYSSDNRKKQVLIDFPIEKLDLSEYVVGYRTESYVYDLYGICNHSGGVLGGHYTSFVKNANGKWYHFNDMAVSEMALNKLVTPKAYCLFYRKRQNNNI